MARFATITESTTDTLWEDIEPKLADAPCLEIASRKFLETIYERFGASLVLLRVFVTMPYSSLPQAKQMWVANLAEEKGVSDDLDDTTPVLSLIGSCGEETAWNNIQNSKDHVGIPLVSPKFVDAIPMVARLLSDLDVGADLGALPREGMDIESAGPSSKTFYVADARTSVDDRNRHIIPMQNFVEHYGVKTVFGVGGQYGEGIPNMLVCIFFTKEIFPKPVAELFESLVDQFRQSTHEFAEMDNIFS